MDTVAEQRAGTVLAIVDEVLRCSPSRASYLHGERHWQAVAVVGAKLCEETPRANPRVVFLFALLHDAVRLHDGDDQGHGARGAVLARRLHRERVLRLGPTELKKLTVACLDHTAGKTSRDPTIGACWDADRLNLPRVGIEPDPTLLSTEVAKKREVIEWAEEVATTGGEPFIWEDVLELYPPEMLVGGQAPGARPPSPPLVVRPTDDVRGVSRNLSVYGLALTPQENATLLTRAAWDPVAVRRAARLLEIALPWDASLDYRSKVLELGEFLDKDRRLADKSHEGLAEYLERENFAPISPYLRFGKLPDGPRSTANQVYGVNEWGGHLWWNERVKEDGISVFEGRLTRGGHYILELTPKLQRSLSWLLDRENRPAYFCWGTPAKERGGDGEPLLTSVEKMLPVPKRCIVASTSHLSYTLQAWNERRAGPLEDRPELQGFFGRG